MRSGIDVDKYPLAAGDFARRRRHLGWSADLEAIKADPAKRQREIEIQASADDTWGRGKLWGRD